MKLLAIVENIVRELFLEDRARLAIYESLAIKKSPRLKYYQ